MARILNDIPLDALVEEFGSTRNAIYKTLYDARRKLRESSSPAGTWMPHDHA